MPAFTFAPKQILELLSPILGKPLLLKNITFQFQRINSTTQNTIELCIIYNIVKANTKTLTVKEISFLLF